MADCGATGSVIDQAARLLQQQSSSSSSKWFEPAARMALPPSSVTTTPSAIPDYLPPPELLQLPQSHPEATKTPSVARPPVVPPVPQPQWALAPPRYDARLMSHPQSQNTIMMQQSIMLQQQQQLLLQRQQQIQWMQQQCARECALATEVAAQVDDGVVSPVSMQELASAWKEANIDVLDDVDAPDAIGATMDELTLAWQHAQLEYQQELDDLTNTNLWTGNVEEDASNAYEFRNAVANAKESLRESSSSLDQPNWMEEGMRAFQAGNLHTAIRAFEMELQLQDMDNATAWTMLGRCHAEQDMDRAAILCLEEAVQRDPYAVEALLALGVSYVNELNQTQALHYLKAWITHNPQFANLDLTADAYGAPTVHSGNLSAANFDEVQRLLLQALESAADPMTTARVLEALGVVYNVSRDYEAAIDVLQQACALRPQEYPLWNKLGATLANGGRSVEALSAYQEALQLKPRYARAWLNMAIAHSNLEQYHDAARCYLQTLSINPAASHVWSFLRIALSCLERMDLLPLVTTRRLEAFSEHFDFVLYQDDVPQHSAV